MKQLNQYIQEKFLIDADTKIGEFGEILYDKSNKPYAMCVIPKGECNNDNAIYMALLDKYGILKWSTKNEFINVIPNAISKSGKENSKYIYKNAELVEYSAFEYTYSLTIADTRKGEWFIGSKEEMAYIAKHKKDIKEQFKINNIATESFFEYFGTYWTSTEYDKYKAYIINLDNGAIQCFSKDNSWCVIPLIEI